MFTKDDTAFLGRLGARAEVLLCSADAGADQLHHTIHGLRRSLRAQPDIDPAVLVELDTLLDAVGWAFQAGDRNRARRLATQLARQIRALDLPGLRAMSVVDAAQQIRALVVLAA
jgi:hypothetical protein